MGRKSKTKSQKKAHTNAIHLAEEAFSSVPHSFVFHRGQVGKNIHQLILDMRRVMEPYTAASLKARKKNSLKDFVAVAGPLGITHFMVFTKTSTSINFKLARLPRGPTLSFRVLQYSLIKDVVSSLKKHRMHEQQFTHHPLLVLNNFGVEGMHIKVMSTMLQNMFPSINVHKTSLNTIKRCVLINYNQDTQHLDFRHFSIKVVPVGMSKGVKKLLQEKFPNMSKFEDISELLKGANLSESEAEQDGEHNIMELPQVYAGRGNMKAEQSAVRLTEIGPRMTLQLVKIEEGLSEGNILYHSFIQKTEEELKMILERKKKKLKLKAERRKKQETDIQRKKEEREAHRIKSLEGMKRTLPPGQDEGDSEAEDPGMGDAPNPADESDEEAEVEYYRQEVGEEPDEGVFLGAGKRKRRSKNSPLPKKKFKKSKEAAGKRPQSTGQPVDQKGKIIKLLGKKRWVTSPKFKGAANPKFKGAANPKFKGAANPKFKGAANPKFKGAANPKFKGAANPKFKGAANSKLKGTANPKVKGSRKQKFKGLANPKLKGLNKGKQTLKGKSRLNRDFKHKRKASQQ